MESLHRNDALCGVVGAAAAAADAGSVADWLSYRERHGAGTVMSQFVTRRVLK